MSIPERIPSRRLELRLLTSSDAASVHAYLKKNRSILEPTEPKRPGSYWTIEGVKQMLDEEYRSVGVSDRHVRYWILLKDRPRIIGSVLLGKVSRRHPAGGALGYRLDRDHLRRGYIKEAASVLLDWAFTDFHLERIEANMMPRNIASRRTAASLGFREYGCTRDFMEINGVMEDHIRTVLYREAWLCSRQG